jgi:hypothetical protein
MSVGGGLEIGKIFGRQHAIVFGHGAIRSCMKIILLDPFINLVNHVLKLSEDYYQARMANQITSNSQRVIDFIGGLHQLIG